MPQDDKHKDNECNGDVSEGYIWDSLTEKVTLKKHEGSKGLNHVDILGKSTPGKGMASANILRLGCA